MLQNTWRWKHYAKQLARALGIAQWKHCKNHFRICKHRHTRYHPKIFMKNLNLKRLNEWCGTHRCTQNMKTQVRSKKVEKKWYKVIQPLWRPNYTKSLNANNFSCNCKNIKTTSNVGPNICVSYVKEGKTQMGGYHYKAKSAKVSQNKQCSSQWVPLSCT
jgi:hypothetical protein